MSNPNNFRTGGIPRQNMGPGGPMMGPGGPMRNNIMQSMNNPGMQNMNHGQGMPPGPGQFQTNNHMPPPNMMGQNMPPQQMPQQEPPKPKMSMGGMGGNESDFFQKMMSQVRTDANNRIDGKQAVSIFKTTGTDINTLKSIYKQ